MAGGAKGQMAKGHRGREGGGGREWEAAKFARRVTAGLRGVEGARVRSEVGGLIGGVVGGVVVRGWVSGGARAARSGSG